MHVRDQIVEAIVNRLRTSISGGDFLAFAFSGVDWDRRTYPYSIVSATQTRVEVEPGSGDRMQRRETQIVVEIHDLETEGQDYARRIGDIAVEIEAVMHGLGDDIPVDAVEYLSDTGVVDEDEDERGIHAGQASVFAVAYYTQTGDASRMIAPNY